MEIDVSKIPNADVSKFFMHQDANLKYESSVPYEILRTEDPWLTYNNFKRKTHLPWLPLDLQKLGRNFPSLGILEEARAIEHLAVSHKSYEGQSKGWKSLCLHGLGTQATLSCDEYGYQYDHETPYKWTEAAELCPITTMYFKNIFPHTRYNRLRFMYLEPGGYICPHEDVIDPNPHFTAVNIAVNQPSGCSFLMGDTDLQSNRRWGHVPFIWGGDAFWLDLRNHHSVVNLSSETRIHIIVHFLLNKEDIKNLIRFTSMFPQSEVSQLSNRNSKIKKLNFVFGYWQPKISDYQEGLQPFIDITERFSDTLTSSVDIKNVIRSSSTDDILSQAAQESSADYLLFIGPGQIIYKNEAFWKELSNELLKNENVDVALWAHIIDKNDNTYLALHPQLFCLDLKKYRTYGTRVFGEGKNSEASLKSWERCKDNVHDDYTPLFVKPAPGYRNANTQRAGWALIHDTLCADFTIRNFSEFLRTTKIHGYPEENFQELAKFRGKNLLTTELTEDVLFEGQTTFLRWLRSEIQSVYSNIWVYNNESVKALPIELKNIEISFIAGPAAGNWDFFYFKQWSRKSDFKFIHYDISDANLEFKKGIVSDLGNEPFQLYLSKYLRNIHPKVTVCERRPLNHLEDYDEIRQCPLWNEYLKAKHHFLIQNLFEDTSPLIDLIPENGIGLVNLSNIFCFLPSMWLYTETETHRVFINFLHKICDKNKNVYVLGKDSRNENIKFEKIDTLLSRLRKNK